MTTAIASAPSVNHGRFAEKHHDLVVKDIEDEAEETSEGDGAQKKKKKTTESAQEKKKRKRKERKEKKRVEKKRRTELEVEEWNGIDDGDEMEEMDEGTSPIFPY
jgi:hypothetical protein